MGVPFVSVSWAGVDGAMDKGSGGVAPGFYAFVAGVICVVVLWKGDKSEHVCYAKVAK